MFAFPFLAAMGPDELMGLIWDTTFFGKGILLILLVLSVMSWAVFIDKARTLARIRSGHFSFWDHLDRWLDGEIGQGAFESWCRDHPDLPLANLIAETRDLKHVPTIRRSSERAVFLETEALERYLILLSTAVTISPFLGLLGTVWGIMSSFLEMSSMQSANLTVVAPGIAEALVTTIAGLATAIPAVIFYNMTVRKIDLVGNELDRLRTILEEAAGVEVVKGPAGRDLPRRPETHDSGSI